MSRKEAAGRAKLSETRWRQIENGWQQKARGVREPTVTTAHTLAQVADAVGIDPAELLELAGFHRDDAKVHPAVAEFTGPPPPVKINSADFTPRERELLNMFFEWARERGREQERASTRS